MTALTRTVLSGPLGEQHSCKVGAARFETEHTDLCMRVVCAMRGTLGQIIQARSSSACLDAFRHAGDHH